MGFRDERMQHAKLSTHDESAETYEDMKLGRILAEEVILMRRHRDMSQKELAARLNTQQSSISRLESRKGLPSLRFLKQVADALDAELLIQFVPREEFTLDGAAD